MPRHERAAGASATDAGRLNTPPHKRESENAMKVNFWQIVGVVLVIIGVVFVIARKTGKNDTSAPPVGTTTTTHSPTTTPAAP
jgi:hypothetical protein